MTMKSKKAKRPDVEFDDDTDDSDDDALEIFRYRTVYPDISNRSAACQCGGGSTRYWAVFRTRDILVRIQILGFGPLNNGSGCGSVPKSSVTLNVLINEIFYYFSPSNNYVKRKGSGSVLVTSGCGSGKPKNMDHNDPDPEKLEYRYCTGYPPTR
jgi:hypothetical protein